MTSLLARFEAAWARSDALFRLIEPSALLDQPIPLRQPLLFYLGHLPAFAWNQIGRGALGIPSWNPAFDALFERGIDPIGVDEYRPADPWPSVADVLAYRDRARDALRGAYADYDALASRGAAPREARRLFPMAIEHELMHQETLLYMINELPKSKKIRPAASALGPLAAPRAPAQPRAKIRVPAGITTLGAPKDREAFGWDNEFPQREIEVPSFLIDTLPVRNIDYLEFVSSGGYLNPSLWDAEAWAWKERRRLRAPISWTSLGRGYLYRTLVDEIPLEDAADLPVYVSFAEAAAYAAWRGERLMTEAEFHRAAYGAPAGPERPHPWGDDPPAPEHGNFDFHRYSPAPAGSSPRGASAWGALELVGNGWEWTASVFEPFPGFEVTIPTYPGYSKDFFDGRHYVLLGASWATDASLLRKSFRNWFQPHYPYVFAKFRCVSAA
jgi:ergothioneine biosynthesis protein EgtB